MTVNAQLQNDYQRTIGGWIWPVVGTLFLVYFVKLFYERKKLKDIIDQIPGPKPFPIFGNLKEIGFFNSWAKNNLNPSTAFNDIRAGVALMFDKEKMFRLWVMGRPVVFLYGADVVETLLTSNISVNKSKIYDLTKVWLGNGLLTSKGGEWKTKRKLLTPSFHFKILQDFIPIMNQHSEILVQKIRQMSKENSWIDIVPLLTYCTSDIISETAMGIKLGCQENPDNEYAKAVHFATFSVFSRMLKPWLHYDFIYGLTKEGKILEESMKIIQDLTAKVIKEKKESKLRHTQNEQNGKLKNDDGVGSKKRLAFLDLLLEKHIADPSFTEKDVTDEVNTFMFAGHDTTSTSLTWTLFLLGLYPDVQKKLYEEVNEAFGQSGPNPEVTQDDMKDLKYMDLVVKECRRLYPSVPGVSRTLSEDLKIGEKVIPKGIEVVVFIQQLHKDKEVFPNPEHFDPDRFSAENSHGRHPYAFVPFSAGPRNCIGQKFAMMEEKVILSHILLNFEVTSLDQRDKVMISPEVVTRPLGPVRVTFKTRS